MSSSNENNKALSSGPLCVQPCCIQAKLPARRDCRLFVDDCKSIGRIARSTILVPPGNQNPLQFPDSLSRFFHQCPDQSQVTSNSGESICGFRSARSARTQILRLTPQQCDSQRQSRKLQESGPRWPGRSNLPSEATRHPISCGRQVPL